MNHFTRRKGELYCEEVPVGEIARKVKTPFYVYSAATLERHFNAFRSALAGHDHLICFAVKSNGNLAVLHLLGRMGAGADIVSGGELYRALKAGIAPRKIVYSGVGKTVEEIRFALREDILMFNVESAAELDVICREARRTKRRARISFRVNPDVDPKTHPYISTGLKKNKFGLPMEEARHVYGVAAGRDEVEVVGVSCHIGSQLTEVSPFVAALRRVRDLLHDLSSDGLRLRFIDVGGGLGIRYRDESPPSPTAYAAALMEELRDLPQTIILEPGRAICGNAGILVTEILYAKKNENRRFLVVDAAMNDLARPSLYGAFHEIVPVSGETQGTETVDVVGPICESGDFLARDRVLPVLAQGDLLAVMSAGAYGFTMSSNYNSRPRSAEVLVQGSRFFTVRKRETYGKLIQGETIPAL